MGSFIGSVGGRAIDHSAALPESTAVLCVNYATSLIARIFSVIHFALRNDRTWSPQVNRGGTDTAPEQQFGAHHAASAEIEAADGRSRQGIHQE